jgi:hypothetical protein
MIIVKELKDNVTKFIEVFELFLALESDVTGINVDFKPFDTHVSLDMSAAWTMTALGGGAQGNVQFCTCCPVRSSRMNLPQDDPCLGCFEMYAHQCYHHAFVNPASMAVYMDYMWILLTCSHIPPIKSKPSFQQKHLLHVFIILRFKLQSGF